MSELNTKYPENPKVGDTIVVTRKATCGCSYDIRCQWDGKTWMYLGSPWCEPHGKYGWDLIEVKADTGQRCAPMPRDPRTEILAYEADTHKGHPPLGVMHALTGKR